jgi:integrase/predicted RNA-binding Zn-ribbon protein involved in translation (DUF1610 family)
MMAGFQEISIFGKAGSPNSGKSDSSESAGTSSLCPQCGSKKLWRDGLRYSPFGDRIQRWLCRNCGFRFSDSDDVQRALSAFERVERVDTKAVKGRGDKAFECQICVEETKNLAATELKTVAGERTSQDVKGALVTFGVKRLTKGIGEETITNQKNILKRLERIGANLLDPLSVWHVIDKAKKLNGEPWSNGTKAIAANAYTQFCGSCGLNIPEEYNFHKWHSTNGKLPFIPTQEELSNLIGSFKTRKAAFLTLLMETGLRSGEAWNLGWTDVDLEKGIVTVNNPEKNGLPRQQRISGKLIAMLNLLPKTTEKIWGGDRKKLYYFRIAYILKRNKIAFNLQNPRIRRIKLHTMRHYYATMEYHRTKDLVHVQEKLGHKSILNTMIYTHLIDFTENEYHSITAKTQTEKLELLSKGWEFICQDTTDGLIYFRKRK